MKKLISFLIALVILLAPCALAEIDLSGLSFAELIELRDRIQQELFTRDEWQAVLVPQGLWKVGEDIPAGSWRLICGVQKETTSLSDYAYVRIGTELRDNGAELSGISSWNYEFKLYNPYNKYFKAGDMTEYSVTLKAGQYVFIDPDDDPVLFMSYIGKPTLGFK